MKKLFKILFLSFLFTLSPVVSCTSSGSDSEIQEQVKSKHKKKKLKKKKGKKRNQKKKKGKKKKTVKTQESIDEQQINL